MYAIPVFITATCTEQEMLFFRGNILILALHRMKTESKTSLYRSNKYNYMYDFFVNHLEADQTERIVAMKLTCLLK